METIIGNKDPSEFWTRRVKVVSDSTGTHYISPVGDKLSFQEILKGREEFNPDKIRTNIRSRGHEFANLGVGGIVTIGNEPSYLLGILLDKGEFNWFEFVAGYVHGNHLLNPRLAYDEELSEEVLPVTNKSRILRFSRDGEVIGRPYSGYFKKEISKALPLVEPARFNLEGLVSPVSIFGKTFNSSLCFDPYKNTAKIVFHEHVGIDMSVIQSLGTTMHHSEDRFDSASGKLEVFLHPNAIGLIRLDSGSLVPEVYRMTDGEMEEVDPTSVLLNKMFATQCGISGKDKVQLVEFNEGLDLSFS
jgi:hypothetical protein